MIKKLLLISNITLFSGNGDILSYEDANLRRETTGVSGLMVARLVYMTFCLMLIAHDSILPSSPFQVIVGFKMFLF